MCAGYLVKLGNKAIELGGYYKLLYSVEGERVRHDVG